MDEKPLLRTPPSPGLDDALNEEMRKASAAAAWGGAPPATGNLQVDEGEALLPSGTASGSVSPSANKLPDLREFKD